MKLYIVALLLTLVAFSSADRVTNAEDFMRGLVRGSLGAVGEDIVGCIQDGEQALVNLFHVAEDFEKALVHGNKAAFKEGLALIGDVIQALPHEVQECKSAAAAVKTLEKLIVEFTNPTALVVDVGKKLIWHSRSIYKDIRKTTDDLKTHDYEDAGYEIGDIIKILFLNSKVSNPIQDTTTLLTSFYKAAFKLDLNMTTCEGSLEKSADEIAEGIQAVIDHKSIDSIVMGFYKAYLGAKDLYDGAHECEGAWTVMQQGFTKLAPFREHPLNILIAGPSAYKSHPIAMTKDLNTLRKALSSTPINFDKLGFSTGDIIKYVLQKM
ncbi:unnamed protein product [Moneuplotes crassus]|uniref:Uncharacterized protein n=1 Tax=Euplotes crassus TaxID=5936 RepID=A0AAD1XLN4_EUPCR|nr:unnamed protein product [Moneuplotes crassus]